MTSALNFLAEVREEFKHVSWLPKKEALRLTLFVIGGSLLVGLFVGGVDALLTKLLGQILLR